MESPETPPMYVIILNWNRPADTLACLEAVRRSRYQTLSAVVVDNGSSDDSVAHIRAAYPQVTLIQNKTNLGYAGGNNVGIRHALQRGAAYVLLLNEDVVVEPEALGHLAAALADPSVAAAGCKVRIFEDPARLWAVGESFPRDLPFP